MKLGVMGALFAGRDLQSVAAYCRRMGLGAIELPVGCYPGSPFFDAAELLGSSAKQDEIKAILREHELELSALSVHGNAVHPDRDRARRDHEAFARAVELAPKLGTNIVITFSGCPGGSPRDQQPNWVTCAWPPEYQSIQKYQWDEVLVPYWAAQAKLARRHGVRIAWEAHPGFAVYNPDTLLRLSERATRAAGIAGASGGSGGSGGSPLGANFDPSHFFWQGIDPVIAAGAIAEAGLLFHVHAKDTELDRVQGPLNGYNDARPYTDLRRRAWTFRTCGYGHGDEFWKPFISMLRRHGYEGAISIEHEDPLMTVEEGFEKAVAYLKGVIIERKAGEAWWV
jgi:sugar phosphate isomerase/epimerase